MGVVHWLIALVLAILIPAFPYASPCSAREAASPAQEPAATTRLANSPSQETEERAKGTLQPLTVRAQFIRLLRQPDGALQLELQRAVELLYGDRSLRTNALQLDTANGFVRGETPFELRAPEGLLRGQSLEYFYEQQRGRFSQVEATLYLARLPGGSQVAEEKVAAYLWAQTMEGDLQQFEAYGVRATTCERDTPDFIVEAARVRLIGGERLRLFNARLRWKGRTLMNLPLLTLRLRERRETLELPTPTYSPETGLGARYQIELPIGARTLFALNGAFYTRAIPETRLALAVALRGEAPALNEPELSQRLESSALYNLRITPERERAALYERATTVRIERTVDVRPLLARDVRLRVSRPFEIGFTTGFTGANGAGGLTLRIGQMRERYDNQRTPLRQRLALEGEWLQPLARSDAFELYLHLWASYVRYGDTQHLNWLRPQLELHYQPSEKFALRLGYALTRTSGSTPFRADQVAARNELALRSEGLWGNLRMSVLLKYDIDRRDLYDLQLLLGWRQHCIEPFVYWRRAPGVLLIGVTLTGLR